MCQNNKWHTFSPFACKIGYYSYINNFKEFSLMSCLNNEAILETLFDEIWEELVTPNFKLLENQDVAILEEYVATKAQERFEDSII